MWCALDQYQRTGARPGQASMQPGAVSQHEHGTNRCARMRSSVRGSDPWHIRTWPVRTLGLVPSHAPRRVDLSRPTPCACTPRQFPGWCVARALCRRLRNARSCVLGSHSRQRPRHAPPGHVGNGTRHALGDLFQLFADYLGNRYATLTRLALYALRDRHRHQRHYAPGLAVRVYLAWSCHNRHKNNTRVIRGWVPAPVYAGTVHACVSAHLPLAPVGKSCARHLVALGAHLLGRVVGLGHFPTG